VARSLNIFLPEVEGFDEGGITADGLSEDIGEGDYVVLPNLGVFIVVHMDEDDAVLMFSAYFRKMVED